MGGKLNWNPQSGRGYGLINTGNREPDLTKEQKDAMAEAATYRKDQAEQDALCKDFDNWAKAELTPQEFVEYKTTDDDDRFYELMDIVEERRNVKTK